MKNFKFVDANGLDTALAYKLVVGCVVPRPIAWITTMNAKGLVNAAPFSSYNYVATDPPMLGVNIASKAHGLKDTARNILETGEFVVNVADVDNMEMMHASAAEFDADVSETSSLGIDLIPSLKVKVPRIAHSPIQMECRLDQSVKLGVGRNVLYIGEIVAFHIWDELFDGERVDSIKLNPVARLGGPNYSALGQIFNKPMIQKPPGGEGWVNQVFEPTLSGKDKK
jgi:flavin reductase (DIM6/NTAB) family NADH-FMN oxidoreductase RutF